MSLHEPTVMGSAVIPIFRIQTCLECGWCLWPFPGEEAGVAHIPLFLLPFLGTDRRGLPCLSSFKTWWKSQSLMITFHPGRRRKAASRKDTQ